MKLLIDQGNSSLKWCLHKDEIFQDSKAGDLETLNAVVEGYGNSLTDVLISCVRNERQLESIQRLVHKHTPAHITIARTAQFYLDLKNGYQEPLLLGVDRWLAMVAAWHRLERGFIIVDAGSALTLDIVDNFGQHLGGHIIPGLGLQKQVLLSDTDGINFGEAFNSSAYVPGNSTETAVHNGCLTNLCSYIEAMYQQHGGSGALSLILTGGDAPILSQALTTEHQYAQNLVLEGLYYSYCR